MTDDPVAAADRYATWVARTGLSDNTKTIYAQRVRAFCEMLAADPGLYDGALTNEDVRDFAVVTRRRQLLEKEKWAPATVQQHMTAIGSFYDHLGLGRSEGVQVEVSPPKRTGIGPDELRRVLLFAKKRGPRDHAIVTVLAYAGLRLGELVAMDVDDVLITERKGQLGVRYGKGGKPRTVEIGPATRAALAGWLDARPGDRFEGPLWVSRTGSRLSRRSVGDVVAAVGDSAGVVLHPHALRHTYARRSVDAGTPVPDLQLLLGHRSPQTTMGYTKPTVEALEAAAARVELDD